MNESVQADQKFKELLESTPDAMVIVDHDGEIVLVNSQAIKLFGWSRADLMGKKIEILMPERFRGKHPANRSTFSAQPLARAMGAGLELFGLRKDGTEFPAEISLSPLKTGEGNLVMSAIRDMTERKRFEQALNEKNVELEHASRMKSEFLATMSHELRTPLNAIIGFSEALKDGLMGQMSDTQHEYIGDIFSSGQHLLSLINDILDLSKVEAGMMSLELEAVDLNSLLSNSLSIVREKAAVQRIHLELDTGDDLGVPMLDMRKTKQIVYNLLSNAVKFSASGGRVTVRTRRVARAAVGTLPGAWPVHSFPLASNEYNEFLEISVSDGGIGISKENMAKLFQPFRQIDSSLARKFEGTGLGLAMVKRLAELHGGAVAVASAEGEGAIFAVWLPLRAPLQAAATVPDNGGAASALGAEPAERIALVVEDDEQAADLVRLLLESEGFTVLRAASAEAALDLAPQQPLSLITLDILLPGIDGWEFLQRIRGSSTLAQVPVVIISGLAEGNMALAGGAAAVLQKPISRAQLKASLANLGLHPASEPTHTVLVVDDGLKTVEVLATFLPSPAVE